MRVRSKSQRAPPDNERLTCCSSLLFCSGVKVTLVERGTLFFLRSVDWHHYRKTHVDCRTQKPQLNTIQLNSTQLNPTQLKATTRESRLTRSAGAFFRCFVHPEAEAPYSARTRSAARCASSQRNSNTRRKQSLARRPRSRQRNGAPRRCESGWRQCTRSWTRCARDAGHRATEATLRD